MAASYAAQRYAVPKPIEIGGIHVGGDTGQQGNFLVWPASKLSAAPVLQRHDRDGEADITTRDV